MAKNVYTYGSWISVDESELEADFVNTVRNGFFEITAAEKVAEHLVDDRPRDDGVVQRDARDFGQVVYSGALHP